jgi:hypothetical protein
MPCSAAALMSLVLLSLATASGPAAVAAGGSRSGGAGANGGRLEPPAAAVAACAGWDVHNASGCTAAGNYSWMQVNTVTACCAACANESGSKCVAWSFHASSSACSLAARAKLATNPGTAGTTCGCRHKGCSGTAPPSPPSPPPTPSPPGPPVPCETEFDCSLNGLCLPSGVCQCDAPWSGPQCGKILYAVTPVSVRKRPFCDAVSY